MLKLTLVALLLISSWSVLASTHTKKEPKPELKSKAAPGESGWVVGWKPTTEPKAEHLLNPEDVSLVASSGSNGVLPQGRFNFYKTDTTMVGNLYGACHKLIQLTYRQRSRECNVHKCTKESFYAIRDFISQLLYLDAPNEKAQEKGLLSNPNDPCMLAIREWFKAFSQYLPVLLVYEQALAPLLFSSKLKLPSEEYREVAYEIVDELYSKNRGYGKHPQAYLSYIVNYTRRNLSSRGQRLIASLVLLYYIPGIESISGLQEAIEGAVKEHGSGKWDVNQGSMKKVKDILDLSFPELAKNAQKKKL